MARYRKIDVRIWGDQKFCELTPAPPCGQTLWFYLITGRETNIIPGLIVAGRAALAESLKWPVEGFAKAFEEVRAKGMAKADWSAHLVWVPNAIRYNRPANPNVVASWREAWDEIPECALKVEAQQALKSFLKGLGEGFAKAFDKVLANHMANQEQDQEQDQEQEKESSSPPAKRLALAEAAGAMPEGTPDDEHRAGDWLEAFPALHYDARGVEFTVVHKRDWPNALRLAQAVKDDRELAAVTDLALHAIGGDWDNAVRSPGFILSKLTILRERLRRAS